MTHIILNSPEDVRKYLNDAALLEAKAIDSVEHLSGGVSSSVWKIVAGENRWVMKQALAKLKVKADWFSDIERIHREHEVMQALQNVVTENSIPKVLHVDYVNHIYIMAYVDASDTWKSALMKGEFDEVLAKDAGQLLKQIHCLSFKILEEEKQKFKDQKYFVQLRVDAFHRYLINQYPELRKDIQCLIEEVTLPQSCLVHGDFSPKNMLVNTNNKIVLIDFEVAHWGNPVFDIAYCIGHLMLKGWFHKREEDACLLIQSFLEGYEHETAHLIPHLGLFLLARMDGKSPIEYITEEKLKQHIRDIAIKWIQNKFFEADALTTIRASFLPLIK